MSLRTSTARSCNAYFRLLAQETPEPRRRDTLASAGFDVPPNVSADAAIGLDPEVTISPRRLLAAYAELTRTPWLVRDELRREWLDGMRDGAENGTAGGLLLRGFLAKTGTTVAHDAPPNTTSGWALVLDAGGQSGWLAFLPRGTGTRAAAELGDRIAMENPTAVRKPSPRRDSASSAPREAPGVVRVRLFSALRDARIRAKNVGEGPARAARGWVGAGAEVPFSKGDRLGDSLWELEVEPYGLRRVVRGSLEAGTSVVLATALRDYVDGVIRGELESAAGERAEELAATVLRFLAVGPRHGTDDVCDLSHCGRFVALGPSVEWLSPTRAREIPSPGLPAPYLDDAAWSRARRRAEEPGPATWTAHCGGEPLSHRSVWGAGSAEAVVCPRHSAASPLPWSRRLGDADVNAAFGGTVTALEAVERNGVRYTRAVVDGRDRLLLYDDIHRLLAARLGWDALPAPPDSFRRTAGGWVAEGRGSGHRVGVCLAG